MIQIYNLYLIQIKEILTADRLSRIAFPCKEFAKFPVDWNSSNSFTYLKELIGLNRLPEMTASDSFKTRYL